MLKQLFRSIEGLGLSENRHGDFSVVTSSFKRSLFNWRAKRTDHSIYEIQVDQNDPELCFITEYLTEEELSQKSPMLFRDLLREIKGKLETCSEHEVLSSAWREINDQYNGRVDLPITDVLIKEEERKIIFVHC